MIYNEHNAVIAAIGGGTGLSTMLRGLKRVTNDVTAIVTVADDGGGSGVLRTELGMPPPGDIRNCLLALANTEPTMDTLMSYRFENGSLKGQSFGNLALAALSQAFGSFDVAVAKLAEVLAITGRVLPVTDCDVRLSAEFESGHTVVGESRIGYAKKLAGERIRRVSLIPERSAATPDCLEAIARADMIVIGPGSLYTSVLPNLLVDGVPEAIAASPALKVYVCNIMTQDGETEGYTAADHVKAIFDHAGHIFDLCLVNSMRLPDALLARYASEDAEPMRVDDEEMARLGVTVVKAPVAAQRCDYARHDPERLASALMEVYAKFGEERFQRLT